MPVDLLAEVVNSPLMTVLVMISIAGDCFDSLYSQSDLLSFKKILKLFNYLVHSVRMNRGAGEDLSHTLVNGSCWKGALAIKFCLAIFSRNCFFILLAGWYSDQFPSIWLGNLTSSLLLDSTM